VRATRVLEGFLSHKPPAPAGRRPPPPSPDPAALRARESAQPQPFPVHAAEPAALERIRGYRFQSGGRSYRIHRGDTHRHTEFSMDGNNDGSLADTYRYAMDAASLDYLMVIEHNGHGGPDLPYINFLL